MDRPLTIGILTVSDRCFKGVSEDTAGPALCMNIKQKYPQWKIVLQEIVPDDQARIEDILISWSNQNCDLILTAGGTGCSPRDVTPEATRAVICKEVPGISQTMLMKSLEITSKAMLSRPVCGIRKESLIINLPGSQKGAVECFSFISSCIPHAVALIKDDTIQIATEHAKQEVVHTPSKVEIDCAALRNRKSPYPMVEVKEANDIIFRECYPTIYTEHVPIENSLHRVLGEDVYATDPLPPFRASVKDGYAIRYAENGTERRVRSSVVAGDKPGGTPIKSNEAIRVSTGAPIPEGAEAVIQVEDTELIEVTQDGREEVTIKFLQRPVTGQDIREIGSDIAANTKVLDRHDVITAAHIGVLAAVGRKTVKVTRRKTIGVLSTGNEVRSHKDVLQPGQIRDSNKPALISLLKEFSYDASDCGVVKDDPNALKSALSKAFDTNDIVITSGGVSMGEFDLMKRVLTEDFEAVIHFGRINMKPGKPTTFATLFYKNEMKIVFGLPGNPASACVTCILFVIPCLRYLERRKQCMFPETTISAVANLKNDDNRPSYMRAKWEINQNSISARVADNQVSSRINNLIGANGFLIVPPNCNDTTTMVCQLIMFKHTN